MLQFYASIILTSGDGVLLINYVLSNEIQTMFPQLAKQPGDLFTDHPLNNQRSVVLRKKKQKREIEGQTLFLFIIVWLLSSALILHVTVYHFSDISC